MQKYLDAIIVGVLTFLVALIMLIVKPGYTPVEVSDDAIALTAGEINFEGEVEEMEEIEIQEEEIEDTEGDSETFEAEDQLEGEDEETDTEEAEDTEDDTDEPEDAEEAEDTENNEEETDTE